MKKLQFLVASAITTAAVLALSGSALAWHPQGKITKSVQDTTSGSTVSTASTSEDALSVAPGDTLVYTVQVSNVAQPAANHDNDMAKTVMTDTLPAGVELISNPSQRTITEDMGTIEPGKNVTKKYSVKVTSTTEGDVITNKACFTGNSLANDNPQSGCAYVTIKIHAPVFSCDALSVSKGDNRAITITRLDTTAKNGATFQDAIISWGDGSTDTTTATPANQMHQYAADGTYKVTATSRFMVDGKLKAVTSDKCAQTVTLTTPPPQLPNTGAGDFILPVALTSIAGYGLYLANLRRRAAKN